VPINIISAEVPTALPRATTAPACDRSGLRSDHRPSASGGTDLFTLRLLCSRWIDPFPTIPRRLRRGRRSKKLRFSMSANNLPIWQIFTTVSSIPHQGVNPFESDALSQYRGLSANDLLPAHGVS
jgi:hypothetical protein